MPSHVLLICVRTCPSRWSAKTGILACCRNLPSVSPRSSLLKRQLQPQKQPYAKLYADFLASGIVSVYRDWVLGGMKQPLEEIAFQIRTMTDGLVTTSI